MKTMDPLEELATIRTMMERSSKFLSLSGLGGVSAGLTALAGSVAAFFILSRADRAMAPSSFWVMPPSSW